MLVYLEGWKISHEGLTAVRSEGQALDTLAASSGTPKFVYRALPQQGVCSNKTITLSSCSPQQSNTPVFVPQAEKNSLWATQVSNPDSLLFSFAYLAYPLQTNYDHNHQQPVNTNPHLNTHPNPNHVQNRPDTLPLLLTLHSRHHHRTLPQVRAAQDMPRRGN